jgi:hypothetical protein
MFVEVFVEGYGEFRMLKFKKIIFRSLSYHESKL